MCFSAPASFTAAAVLLGLGTVTMRRARSRRELPYAAIPLLFGVQQLLEGMLWLTFPDRAPLLNVALTHLYSFFSHVLWPIYVPLAALALESVRWRRRVLVAIAVAGALVGLYLLAMLVKLPITAVVFTDDTMASPRGVKAMHSHYTGTQVDLKVLRPEQHGLRAVGHFQFFHPKTGSKGWSMSLPWLGLACA